VQHVRIYEHVVGLPLFGLGGIEIETHLFGFDPLHWLWNTGNLAGDWLMVYKKMLALSGFTARVSELVEALEESNQSIFETNRMRLVPGPGNG